MSARSLNGQVHLLRSAPPFGRMIQSDCTFSFEMHDRSDRVQVLISVLNKCMCPKQSGLIKWMDRVAIAQYAGGRHEILGTDGYLLKTTAFVPTVLLD